METTPSLVTPEPGRSPADTVSDLVARMDRLPVLRLHIGWIVVLGVVYMIESFDNGVFAYVAPSVRADWGISLGQVGLVTSGLFVGMTIGALLGGRLADRIGRRPMLMWSSVGYAGGSLISALAPNYEVLLASRVITGIGVQAATGVIIVYISEMYPKLSRGRFFTVMIWVGSVVTPVTGFVVAALTSASVSGWRWVFVLGASGLVIAVIAGILLPETVRWNATHGRTDQALRTLERMERAAEARGHTLAEPVPVPTTASERSLRSLLHPRYRRRLVALTVGFVAEVFCVYAYFAWVPTVLVEHGVDKTRAVQLTGLVALGGLIMPLIMWAIADRVERKTAILGEVLIASAAIVVFGFSTNVALSVVVMSIAGIALAASTASYYTYLPESFPTEIRGVAVGLVNSAGRIAGIVSGVVVGAAIGSIGPGPLYVGVAIFWIAATAVLFVMGPRTSRRSLEAISSE